MRSNNCPTTYSSRTNFFFLRLTFDPWPPFWKKSRLFPPPPRAYSALPSPLASSFSKMAARFSTQTEHACPAEVILGRFTHIWQVNTVNPPRRRKPIYSLINAFKCVGGILEVRPIQNVSQKPDIWILVNLAKRRHREQEEKLAYWSSLVAFPQNMWLKIAWDSVIVNKKRKIDSASLRCLQNLKMWWSRVVIEFKQVKYLTTSTKTSHHNVTFRYNKYFVVILSRLPCIMMSANCLSNIPKLIPRLQTAFYSK